MRIEGSMVRWVDADRRINGALGGCGCKSIDKVVAIDPQQSTLTIKLCSVNTA